jgi:hypothetical protein
MAVGDAAAADAAADASAAGVRGEDGVIMDEDDYFTVKGSSLPPVGGALRTLVAELNRDGDDSESNDHRMVEAAVYALLTGVSGHDDDAEQEAGEILRELRAGPNDGTLRFVFTARVVNQFLRIYSRSSRDNPQAGDTCCELLRGLWETHDALAMDGPAAAAAQQRYRPTYESHLLALQAVARSPAGPTTDENLSPARRAESILNDMERRSAQWNDESLSPTTECVNLVLYVTKSERWDSPCSERCRSLTLLLFGCCTGRHGARAAIDDPASGACSF